MINILASADDLVLMAPSWKGIQVLLSVLHVHASAINLSSNTNKTMHMMFPIIHHDKVIAGCFSLFKIGYCNLRIVHFIYLCLYILYILVISLITSSKMIYIRHEICCTFVCTHILHHRFHNCSSEVKVISFKPLYSLFA